MPRPRFFMPTYEYRCRKCGHRFEIFQRIVDPPVRNCPKCRARGSVEQVISGGSGLIFKGSGFYETDYRRSKQEDSSDSSPSPASPSPTQAKPGSTDSPST